MRCIANNCSRKWSVLASTSLSNSTGEFLSSVHTLRDMLNLQLVMTGSVSLTDPAHMSSDDLKVLIQVF